MMNKYKKGGYMQPSKEVTFGGVKRRKAADGGSGSGDGTKDNPYSGNTIRNDLGHTIKNGAVYDIKGKYLGRVMKPHTNASRGIYSPGGTDPNIPKSAREVKQNTPQGTGAGRTGKSGSNANAKKGSSYADAKKKDPKLDSYIKTRNNSKKGSDEYIMAQNKINKAYGKGPQRKLSPIKPVKALEAKPIERKSTPDKPIGSTPITTPTPKSTPKSNTGGGSGMGGVQAEKDKIADLKSTPAPSATPDRRAKRKGRKAARQTKREAIKDAKGNLKAARKMTAGGMKTPSADQKGLQKLPTTVRNKMGYKRAGGKKAQSAISPVSLKKKGSFGESRKLSLKDKIKLGNREFDASMKAKSEAGMTKPPGAGRRPVGVGITGGAVSKPTLKKAGGKKKAMFGIGNIAGAIGGMKGAQGGFGKKLFGAAKGLAGGGLGGRLIGGVGSMLKGGKFGEGFKGGAFGNSNPMANNQIQGGGEGPVSTEPQMTARKGGRKDRRLRRADKAHASAAAKGKKIVGTRKGVGDPRMLNQPTVPVYAREQRIRDRVEKTATNKTKRDDKKKNRKGFTLPKITLKSRPYIGIGKKNIFGNYKKVRRKKIR